MDIYPNLNIGMFALVKNAEHDLHLPLSANQEYYLVTLLSESAHQLQQDKHQDIAQLDHEKSVVVSFADGLHYGEAASSGQFKRLGDSCLILSGMFVEHIRSKRISQKVYSVVGANSYSAAACLTSNKSWKKLLNEVADSFCPLTKVLRAIRADNKHKFSSATR